MNSEVECSFERSVPLCQPAKSVVLCIGYSVRCPGLGQVRAHGPVLRKLVSVTVASQPSASCACDVPQYR